MKIAFLEVKDWERAYLAEQLRDRALGDARIAELVRQARIAKTVVVPKKLINIVLAP